jgi:hypothetical protein
MAEPKNILDSWGVTYEELAEMIDANPSLRGFLFGYVAEHKLKNLWFSKKEFSDRKKYDEHNRKLKGDVSFVYKGVEIRVESKSLQTNSIRRENGVQKGNFQCDASDSREVTLPNGNRLKTTCLLVGEFDLLAVNLFQFEKKWKFAFAKNADLPRTTYEKYTPYQRKYLLATLMNIQLPLKPPYESEPFRLLNEIVTEKKRKQD